MAAERANLELTVYSRTDCHLCDDMISGLRTLQARFHFGIRIVDVDRDRVLEARYGDDVPVLTHASHQLCQHRLDLARVTDYLTKIG